MARSYEDLTRQRRAQLDAASQKHAEVFGRAYRLAMRVVDLRARHGLTQAQLAERCGMDQADICRIERGSIAQGAAGR